MNRSYNSKALVKLIKKAAKDTLFWQRTEDAEYVTNSHWMVKAPQFDAEVKAALYGVFGRECNAGQSFGFRFKQFNDNGPDLSRVHNADNAKDAGVLTPLVYLPRGDVKSEIRVVKLGDKLVAIQNEYAALIDESVTECRGTFNAPIFFGTDADVLILPVRLERDLAETIAEILPGGAAA